MRCEWQALLSILPPALRPAVDKQGRETLQELRLRLGSPPELVTAAGSRWLQQPITKEEIFFCINATTKYSPWSASTVSQGYLTAPGGHRIGICGEVTVSGGVVTGIREPTSLCIRVARDFPGIGRMAAGTTGSLLLLGKPGSGKTTLLRDIVRQRSDQGTGAVAVVDERGEVFPYSRGQPCFPLGKRTDILTGCKKAQGIEMVLRSMNPDIIALDEITAEADCAALLHAGWCGVDLIATAHASGIRDLLSRPVYRPILESRLFERVIILRQDKSWTEERLRV